MTDEDIRAALLVAGDDEGRPRGFAIDEVVARGRRRRRTPWVVAGAAAATVVAAWAVVGPQPAGEDGPDGDAGCAAVVELDGVEYVGHGELMWSSPPTTGRAEEALQPACDDGNGRSPERTVEAEELAALPLARGFLSDGQIYLRVGAPFPEKIRHWFARRGCGPDAPAVVHGGWIAVWAKEKPRFDGDIQAPLWLDLKIDPDSPGAGEYAGWQIRIHDTGAADPGLTKADVEDALWSPGTLEVRLHCVGRRWVADGFRVQR